MTVDWGYVVAVDLIGSFLTLITAVLCAYRAWEWRQKKSDDIFRDYIFLLTLAFVFFVVSRAVGHLLRHFLLYYDLAAVWAEISPFSGAANSAVFMIIFAFSIYFQRFQRMHLELRDYKNNLEQLVAERTAELEEENIQRQTAQEELRQVNASLENIFNSASPICITDLAFNLVETNEAYRQIWHDSGQSGMAVKCYESRPGNLCHTPDCPMQQITQGEEEVVLEASHQTDEGQDRVFLQTTRPFRDADGKILGIVTSFQEITERIQAQEELALERECLAKELIKTQKLESVGILAGGIAHDFNNILTAILGNIDLAIRLFDHEHQAAPLLAEAQKASLRAKGLTQQLLTFAKGGSPVRRTVAIAEIIKDLVVFILRGSNVRCELDIPEDLRLLDIDPDQMSQVIQNIIINAAQAMPEGGTIYLACRNQPADGEGGKSSQDAVAISITDHGPGISPEIMDKLFDPYFTTKNQGSGLGLSICHSIVSQHGGTISATSSPGEGATFTILLPTGGGDNQLEDEALAGHLADQKGVRILLMDDNEMVNEVSQAMLRHLGHETELARDGQEAVRLYRQAMEEGRNFALIIMDLTIPGGMGGKEAVREIHQLDPGARVIVASGYSNDPVMASFAEYGFSYAGTGDRSCKGAET